MENNIKMVANPNPEILAQAKMGKIYVVLAKVSGYLPYVTWATKGIDSADGFFWGHYFKDEESARADFVLRMKRGY